MEVIEISSSDEEEPSKRSKRSPFLSSFPEVIVVSSPSDREDSPSVSADGIKTLRISTSRLNRLREITKKNLVSGTHRRSDRASVNNGHSCDSPIISSSDDGECSLPSMFCHAELETENFKHATTNENKEYKGTPVKAQVKLADIRQSPLKDPDDRQYRQKDSEFGQSPQRDGIYRQSPLHKLLKETSNKAVYNRSPTKRNLLYYQKMQKSPVKSLFSSPKLKQATLTMESFSPKRICSGQPSGRQASPVPVIPPEHIIPVDLSSPNSGAQFFTEAQLIILESLLEEEVLQFSFLNTVMSFTSQSRKPTPELAKKMLQRILMNSRKAAVSFSCYRSLKIIQALHPDVTAHAIGELRWDFVQEIVEQLDLWRCSDDQPGNSDNGMASQNATLALTFVVSVLEDDLKQKQNARKSKVFRMLSTTSCLQNVEKVVEWIRVEVQHHCRGPACHQDSCVVPPGCYQDVLGLLQRLLRLSIDVSDMPIDSARRVTNGPLIWAYMHPSVSSTECKSLLVESLQSHLLRSTFIELIFQNYCQDMGNPYHCGLQRIVRTYFLYPPPSYTVEPSSACRSQAECEEFVMLLAFLMQSYIFCNTGCCQTNPETRLSLEEVETLQHVEKYVRELQERLETLCNPLSEKAYGFLNLMISLQMFAK